MTLAAISVVLDFIPQQRPVLETTDTQNDHFGGANGGG